jgi:DNA-binding MarR family transcriptional regulator
VSTLESRGLVKKEVDRKDQRNKHLSLPPKGESLLLQVPRQGTVTAIEQLASSAQQSLAKGLQPILKGLLAARDRQPFGQCRDCRYFANRHPEGAPHYCLLLKEKLAKTDALAICIG